MIICSRRFLTCFNLTNIRGIQCIGNQKITLFIALTYERAHGPPCIKLLSKPIDIDNFNSAFTLSYHEK